MASRPISGHRCRTLADPLFRQMEDARNPHVLKDHRISKIQAETWNGTSWIFAPIYISLSVKDKSFNINYSTDMYVIFLMSDKWDGLNVSKTRLLFIVVPAGVVKTP